MSEPHIRIGDVPVVHSMTPNGWTTCGVMYSIASNAFFFMKAAPTDDPVDCMACLIQEARDPIDTIHFSGPIALHVPLHIVTLKINLEPEPEPENE